MLALALYSNQMIIVDQLVKFHKNCEIIAVIDVPNKKYKATFTRNNIAFNLRYEYISIKFKSTNRSENVTCVML